MADDAPTELARNILRNIIPLEQDSDMGRAGQKVQDTVMGLLQRLGLMQPPPPPLNAPLPRYNPKTGQIDQPGAR